MESSIKACSYCTSSVFACEILRLFITEVAVKSLKTITYLHDWPLQTHFCFYFGAQVSKYQVTPPPFPRLCYICVLTLPCNDHLNPIWIDTVFFGMLPIPDDLPSHPESPVHPSTPPPPPTT